MTNRYYDAIRGAFISADFDPSSRQRYVYARSNPLDLVDPLGLRATRTAPSCPIDSMDCVDAPPLSPNAPNPYGPGDYYKNINAQMMFDLTDNEPWSNCVRGCLACMFKRGVDADVAHRICYIGCAKKNPVYAGSGFLGAVGTAAAIAFGQVLGITPP